MSYLRCVAVVAVLALLLGVASFKQNVGVADDHRVPMAEDVAVPVAPTPNLTNVLKGVTALVEQMNFATTSTTTSTTTTTTPPAPTTVSDYTSAPDWPMFRALAICETGLNWSHETRDYVSAFGFARSTFRMDAAALGLPDWHANYARTDQLRVARYGREQGQEWGCASRVPGF